MATSTTSDPGLQAKGQAVSESTAVSTEARAHAAGVCVAAQVAAALIEQAVAVIESVTDESYRTPSTRLAGGTIGKHVRHCADHFVAALSAVSDPATVIDYDHRARNVPMESCRLTAAGELRKIVDQLRRVEAAESGAAVRVRVMLTGDGHEAELGSTLGRELAFAAHHAVHHHAMIKVIAEEFGEALPVEFGKAPSTINFEQGNAER